MKNDILTNLSPIIVSVGIIGIIVMAGISLWKRQVTGAIAQVVVGFILIYILKNPNEAINVAGSIVGFLKGLGGSING